jgi:hypothetical protein
MLCRSCVRLQQHHCIHAPHWRRHRPHVFRCFSKPPSLTLLLLYIFQTLYHGLQCKKVQIQVHFKQSPCMSAAQRQAVQSTKHQHVTQVPTCLLHAPALQWPVALLLQKIHSHLLPSVHTRRSNPHPAARNELLQRTLYSRLLQPRLHVPTHCKLTGLQRSYGNVHGTLTTAQPVMQWHACVHTACPTWPLHTQQAPHLLHMLQLNSHR